MALNTEFSRQVLVNPVLAINAAASPLVKTTVPFASFVSGQVVLKAAGALPALTGTIANGFTSSYAFFMDALGVVTVSQGNSVANTSTLSFSDLPKATGNVCIGLVIVVNATGALFTGGTTALDTGSLTTYYTTFPVSGL